MKRFVMTIVLACALSSTAFAGIIHSTDAAAAPPQPQASSPVLEIILTIISIVR